MGLNLIAAILPFIEGNIFLNLLRKQHFVLLQSWCIYEDNGRQSRLVIREKNRKASYLLN